MLHVVGNEDHAHPVFLEAADELEHLRGLLDAEGRGRLVEDDYAPAPQHGPRDREALTLAAGHLFHVRTDGRDLDMKAVEDLPGAFSHLAGVDQVERA